MYKAEGFLFSSIVFYSTYTYCLSDITVLQTLDLFQQIL